MLRVRVDRASLLAAVPRQLQDQLSAELRLMQW